MSDWRERVRRTPLDMEADMEADMEQAHRYAKVDGPCPSCATPAPCRTAVEPDR